MDHGWQGSEGRRAVRETRSRHGWQRAEYKHEQLRVSREGTCGRRQAGAGVVDGGDGGEGELVQRNRSLVAAAESLTAELANESALSRPCSLLITLLTRLVTITSAPFTATSTAPATV